MGTENELVLSKGIYEFGLKNVAASTNRWEELRAARPSL